MSAMNVHGVGHVPRGASGLLPLSRCASANGITPTARNRSTKNAARRRCALMAELFCFCIFVYLREEWLGWSAVLLENAEECQANFRKSSVNCGWSRTDRMRKRDDEPRMSNDGREESAANR